MSQSLVFGYLREIEKDILNHLIPGPIYQLCLQYYLNSTILYFVSPNTENAPNIDVIDIDNHPTNTWRCCIQRGCIKHRDILSHSLQDLKVAGMCSGANIVLPPCISNKLQLKHRRTMPYNMLFICGTTKLSRHCSSIILDHQSKSGFHWNLPVFPKVVSGNDLVFSSKYGLLFIGGSDSSKQAYKLSFSNKAYMDQNMMTWQWKKLHKNMKHGRFQPSSVLIGHDKLMVIGGMNYQCQLKTLQSMEIYDFTVKKWKYVTNCIMYQRMNAGVLYDEQYGNIYIGGGRYAKNKVEHYNVHKQRSYNVCDTRMEHKTSPVLWKDKFNANVLYIASGSSNGIEYIDLRTRECGWKPLYEPNCSRQSLLDAFDIHPHATSSVDACHFLVK